MAQALRYLETTADGGDWPSATMLGRLFFFGATGVPRDTRRGYEWLLKAADEGKHAPAMALVGGILRRGEEGVTARDAAEALRWFEKGALQKDAASQNGLARMLLHGDGVPRDIYRAKHLLELAANKGASLLSLPLSFVFCHLCFFRCRCRRRRRRRRHRSLSSLRAGKPRSDTLPATYLPRHLS